MTIEEQHIAIEQAFQKIGASQWDNLLPEEIDMALNVAQERFVKKSFSSKNTSFSDNQRHLDDIQVLLVKNKSLRTYIPTESNEPNVVVAELPIDYLFLVNDRSTIAQVLTNNCFKKPNLQVVESPVGIVTLPFPDSYQTQYPYYRQLILHLNTELPNNPGNITSELLFDIDTTVFQGVVDTSQKFELVRIILEALNKNSLSIDFYWERYNNYYKPSSFIGVYQVDGSVVNPMMQLQLDNVLTSYGFEVITRKVYMGFERSLKKTVANRLTDTQNLYKTLVHPFGKSTSLSPISSLAHNKLFTYEANFSVIGTSIDYIRKPSRLSKNERLSCELSAHTHQEINDLAVEYLQLSTTNPAYQLKVTDDLTRGEN